MILYDSWTIDDLVVRSFFGDDVIQYVRDCHSPQEPTIFFGKIGRCIQELDEYWDP